MSFRPWKLLCLAMILSFAGCQKFNLRSQNPDDDDDTNERKTTLIGDQVTVAGLHAIQVECVSLATGLDGTGGDTPPSIYRTMLLQEMRARNVKDPNRQLQSPGSALVIVRAALPPVIQVGDRFDVEVALPENTDATSLRGGWLMEAKLSEQAIVPGRGPIKGHTLATAEGPVLLSTGEGEKSSLAGVLKRGRVLGGGVYKGGILKKGRDLGLYVRNDLRSVRQTRRLADAIGKRFFHFEHGLKRPLASAKTDQYIELKIHPRYKENYVRYVQVIRHIALNETQVEQKERMERLRKGLLVPQTAAESAMELEAIGSDAAIILKEGLKSPNAEVRFYSADSLVYLGDSSGAKELAAAARNEEAFRVFALASLAVLDEPVTREALRKLMIEPTMEAIDGRSTETWSAETRYGAFRALWTLDKTDEAIRGELIRDEFTLHVIKSDGDPMIHLCTHRVPEVVLFGNEPRLRTPVSLSAGNHIMITAPAGSETVTISRFEVNKDDEQIITSTRVEDIVRAVGKLRGSYPDVAQMLTQAERQSNVVGRLQLDALPQGGRIFYRPPTVDGDDAVAKRGETTRVGKAAMVPNMFPMLNRKAATEDEQAGKQFEPSDGERADAGGEASLSDTGEDAGAPEEKTGGGFLGLFRKK